MSKLRSLLVLPVALLAVACSSGASPQASDAPSPSPGASGGGSPSPVASPAGETIDHPTGAEDIVLRMGTGGAYTFIGWAATETPSFTLYGDGTVIARDGTAPGPDPGPDGLMKNNPFFTAKLPEDQVQALLEFALSEGGLGVARARYENSMVTDVEWTTFTIDAGGIQKTVEVYALGFDSGQDPDAAIKAAFVELSERLRLIAADLPIAADQYVPDRWRGVLIDAEPGQVGAPAEWPWADLSPADFVADPNGPTTFPHRVLTSAQVEALGIGDPAGGVQNVALQGPDGEKLYQLALRPLLPGDEA
jgi:hypothetical protein